MKKHLALAAASLLLSFSAMAADQAVVPEESNSSEVTSNEIGDVFGVFDSSMDESMNSDQKGLFSKYHCVYRDKFWRSYHAYGYIKSWVKDDARSLCRHYSWAPYSCHYKGCYRY